MYSFLPIESIHLSRDETRATLCFVAGNIHLSRDETHAALSAMDSPIFLGDVQL